METTSIRSIFRTPKQFLNGNINVSGWVRTVRANKDLAFIALHDGTFFTPLQIVAASSLSNFAAIDRLPIGSAISVIGKLVESQGGGQKYEIQAEKVEIIQEADADFPLQKKRHTMEYLRTIAHLRPRTNTFQAVFRLRSVLAGAIHEFFQSKNFVYVHTPIITGSDCEGAGEMFHVTTFDLEHVPQKDGAVDYSHDFFKKPTSLTVSGQLNGEAFAMAFRDIYTFGPTFRAENSNTTRHASEFWMIEPEIAFANLADNMHLAEEMMKFLFKTALEKLPEEMAFFDEFIQPGLIARLQKIIDSDFERMPYDEAIKILQASGKKFEFPVKWGLDLQSEHEQYICEKVGRPTFLINYPKDIKAFYMRLNDDGKTVAAMDLLVPGVGEIIGGSQREERLDRLDARIEEMGLNKEDYWWYRDLRRFGGVEHAGFGLGFERLVQYVSGVANIRDVIPFPRTPKNAEF
jgi:asparaginyl-tRNA synthetase